MRIAILAVLLVVVVSPAGAANKTVQYFYDAARIEYDLQAHKGIAEIALPSDMQPNSLRVRPFPGAVLTGVSISSAPSKKPPRAQARLDERRNRLLARLKAVEAREEIFTSAAKSQSAKAPRKTKTNPDPIGAIRQGTDHALYQLEETYRMKMQTEGELRELERQAGTAGGKESFSGSIARVHVKPAGARIRVSYILPRQHWKPAYDFHLSGKGMVEITQKAVLPFWEKGADYRIVPASIASDVSADSVPAARDQNVARFSFPSVHERVDSSGLAILTFSFRNETSSALPPGEAACYRNGEYFGMFSFPGIRPGETAEVTCGK